MYAVTGVASVLIMASEKRRSPEYLSVHIPIWEISDAGSLGKKMLALLEIYVLYTNSPLVGVAEGSSVIGGSKEIG
jgi:hypothetical protein